MASTDPFFISGLPRVASLYLFEIRDVNQIVPLIFVVVRLFGIFIEDIFLVLIVQLA